MEKIEARTINGHQINCVELDTGGKDIVIFCHGYRGSSIGPNRFFVRTARKLAEAGISSLRFDQYGSGNSEGDFYESSFNDWVATTTAVAKQYQERGYRVALFGQSMGGATVLAVASAMPEIASVVAWVPDPNVDTYELSETGFEEEGGQRVQAAFWQEAHAADIVEKLSAITAPLYVVQCSKDEFVSSENHRAIEESAAAHHVVEMFDGYAHSNWSYDQATEIIDKSVDFLVSALRAS